MPEIPEGYREVPEEDRKKAQVFFGHGDTKTATGQFDFAISMYLEGLRFDPDAVEAHKKLLEVSLKRKASGGKGLGMLEVMKLKKSTKDDTENLLNAERLMAFDPGNVDHMLTIAQSAAKAGYWDTALWIGPLLAQAEADSGKPSAKLYLALRDVYVQIKQWRLAMDCLFWAMKLKPNDMDLQREARDLGARVTMAGAGYDKAGSFRDQVRDMKSQLNLLNIDKEIADADVLADVIIEAEKQMAADPQEPGKAMKLVDLLVKTDKPDLETRAAKILQEWFDKTKQFRFRQRIGQIRMKQQQRQERIKRKAAAENPDLKKDWAEFRHKMDESELAEYKLWAEAYPTDLTFKFEIGKRQFNLRQFDDAIGSFQQARNDPKQRVDAIILLGRAFLEAEFLDEADDTLAALIRDFQNRESPKFLEMCYYRGRTLEQKGAAEDAIKQYSTVFQIDSGYKDVAGRIKRLRAAKAAPPPAATPSDDDL